MLVPLPEGFVLISGLEKKNSKSTNDQVECYSFIEALFVLPKDFFFCLLPYLVKPSLYFRY